MTWWALYKQKDVSFCSDVLNAVFKLTDEKYLVQGVGFEPTKAKPLDLQSSVFDRFTNPAIYQLLDIENILDVQYTARYAL